MNPLRLSLFALIFLAVLGMSQEAEAGLVEVYMNGAEDDLVVSEEDATVPFGTDITLQFYIKGA